MAKLKLNPERLEILWNRGVVVLKVPAPTIRHHGEFKWLLDPFSGVASEALEGATWYTDGSLVGGQTSVFRCTGFGVVVVAASGELLGFGYGTPPSRIATAAAAELWAVDFVLAANPTAPRMKTDCLSIITAARSGVKSATSAARPLARL